MKADADTARDKGANVRGAKPEKFPASAIQRARDGAMASAAGMVTEGLTSAVPGGPQPKAGWPGVGGYFL